MSKIEHAILRFARHLQNSDVPTDVNNFYAAKWTNSRRHNLQVYLRQMAELKPDTLLVGEAPGHNGCARTGIPFSSEKLLRDGVLGGRLFGAHNGYRVSKRTVVHEQSAAAMWAVLAEVERIPLLWNAYPFHPHLPANPNSNRKPKVSELETGIIFLEELIDIFEIKKVIAVGNAAGKVLNRMGLEHAKVRHPSYGGRAAFSLALKGLLED
jgi:uracil-DNA glycosylase